MNKDNKELMKILKSLNGDPELGPAAEFRADLKQRLMAEVKPAGWFMVWPEFSRGSWGRRLAWAIAGVVLMVAGTTTVLAQNSLPTDKLYPVKIAGERAAMAAAKDEWKPQIAAGIADRRLDEIHQLEKNEDTEAAAGAVDNYRRHLTQAEHFRNGADEEWAAGIDRHWATLKQLEENLETESIPAAETAPVRPTQTGGKAPQPVEAEQREEIRTNETWPETEERNDQKDDNKNNKQQPGPIPVPKDLPLNLLP